MTSYYAGKFYELVQKDLTAWVWNNQKLSNKITQHNLLYLFEFDPKRGLSIDLRRFEPEYYREVFYPPKEKKAYIDEFVRKVCLIIRKSLKDAGKPEVNITITVRHMVSEISHWKTFFIDGQSNSQTLHSLIEKGEGLAI
jgi:hypothetical protein